jgi:hypothetical protein
LHVSGTTQIPPGLQQGAPDGVPHEGAPPSVVPASGGTQRMVAPSQTSGLLQLVPPQQSCPGSPHSQLPVLVLHSRKLPHSDPDGGFGQHGEFCAPHGPQLGPMPWQASPGLHG